MQKIPTLFARNYEGDRLVRNELVPGTEWVAAGEGTATRKLDGTCCLIRDGQLYKRYDAKKGKTPPPDFLAAQDAPDPNTGHWPGWLPVGDGPEDRYHREAWETELSNFLPGTGPADGTCELIGPKVQGNAEGRTCHWIDRHAEAEEYPDCPRDFDGLKEWLTGRDIEGIVWHHPDGRMCKLKLRDFGLKRR